jgi:acyl-CoA dehydrogenase
MPMTAPDELADLRELQRAARDLVDHLLSFERLHRERGEVPAAVSAALRENGYHALAIPEEYGGLGLGALGTCLVFEELGRMPMSFFTAARNANSVGSRALVVHGSEAQKRRWLPGIAAGEVLTAFALTEPDAGSDVSRIRTTATADGDGFRLNGTKHFITNGHKASLMTVIAYTDRSLGRAGGMTAFLVEPDGLPGFTVRRVQESMAGPPHLPAEIEFADAPVPAENVLGGVGNGFAVAGTALVEGRLHVAAVALGIAKQATREALAFARDRQAFGSSLTDFQAIQHKLADMATQLYAGRQMLHDACRRLDDGEDVFTEAAMTKLFCTEAAWRIVDEALQVHGGMGYMREMPVERMYRDVRLLRIVEGTSEIQRRMIAKSLIDDPHRLG